MRRREELGFGEDDNRDEYSYYQLPVSTHMQYFPLVPTGLRPELDRTLFTGAFIESQQT